MRSLASAFEHLLLPPECLSCRQLLPFRHRDRTVCDVCRHRWRPVRSPWCARCGQPGPHFGRCPVCADWPAALARVRSAVWLDGGARDAVHALKYGGLGRAAVDLAAAMVRHLAPPAPAAVLLPVPLAARRLRRRGYNQSARVAAALGRVWGCEVVETLLSRTRETATQTALTPEARLANVAGAFRVRSPVRTTGRAAPAANPAVVAPHSPFVLVDDVFTTGATLAECARALAAAGVSRLEAVTFGRAVIPDFT